MIDKDRKIGVKTKYWGGAHEPPGHIGYIQTCIALLEARAYRFKVIQFDLVISINFSLSL